MIRWRIMSLGIKAQNDWWDVWRPQDANASQMPSLPAIIAVVVKAYRADLF